MLEAIPRQLAAYTTERLTIPTIGIGAGPATSGQVRSVLPLAILPPFLSSPPISSTVPRAQSTLACTPSPFSPPLPQPTLARPQVLVWDDMLSTWGGHAAKFVRHFAAVRARAFPRVPDETYAMDARE